jgi:hypothetical protein
MWVPVDMRDWLPEDDLAFVVLDAAAGSCRSDGPGLDRHVLPVAFAGVAGPDQPAKDLRAGLQPFINVARRV